MGNEIASGTVVLAVRGLMANPNESGFKWLVG